MPTVTAPKLGLVMLQLKSILSTQLPTIDVYASEPITEETPANYVMIGSDGDPDSDASADFTHVWVDMAHTRKREEGEIPCALVSWTGDTDTSATITAAFGTLTTCVNALSSDETITGLVYGISVTSGSAKQINDERGLAVVIPFTVMYWAHV